MSDDELECAGTGSRRAEEWRRKLLAMKAANPGYPGHDFVFAPRKVVDFPEPEENDSTMIDLKALLALTSGDRMEARSMM